MLLYTVADGLKVKLNLNNEKAEIKIVDGVRGQLQIYQTYRPGHEKEGLVFKDAERSPGNYTMVFKVHDGSIGRNCSIPIQVKCKFDILFLSLLILDSGCYEAFVKTYCYPGEQE